MALGIRKLTNGEVQNLTGSNLKLSVFDNESSLKKVRNKGRNINGTVKVPENCALDFH